MVNDALGVPALAVRNGEGESRGDEDATLGVESGKVGATVTVTVVGEAFMVLFVTDCFCVTLWPINITEEIRMILNTTARVINIFLLTPGFF